MKQCPKCGRKWPDTGKFCPFDGTSLEEEKRPEPESIRTSATVIMEAPKDIEALKSKLSKADEAKKKKQFSETQWYMKGITPEDHEELTADGDVEAATEKYEKKEDLDTGVRKQFSLADTFRRHKGAKEEKQKKASDAFLALSKKEKKK